MTPITPYIVVDDADDYFSDRLNTDAWDTANDIDKLKALKTATRLINNLRFIGQVAMFGQPNEFPRLGQSSVPDAIAEATCELALQLLDDVDPNIEIDNIAVLSDTFANVKTAFDRSFALPHIRNGIPSSEAWMKLLPYLTDPLSVRLVMK